MALMDDCIEWLDFCDYLVREISDSKPSEYKDGQVDGLKMATDMMRAYLEVYPDFVDPIHKFDKFKILLSNKLLIPEYKSLYTAIDKYILQNIRELDFDIDIVYINSIEKRLYKKTPVEFSLPKFKSLGEMKIFLNNLYKEL